MKKPIIALISWCMFLGLALEAQAEINNQQAPLFFELNINGPKVFESENILTNGTITAIAASWEFSGEARLQVSANGGNAYADIINGQLITGGFLPGNSLKFKFIVGDNSFLKALTLGYRDSSGAQKIFVNKNLPQFKYKQILKIDGAKIDLFNYPVKVRLDSQIYFHKGMVENFKDVRFISSDGQTQLDYYLEKIQLNKGLPLWADFWVKIPQLPKEGIYIYIFYGNPSANDESNPDKVFLYFDDFVADNIDDTKWVLRCDLDSVNSSKRGYLQLKNCTAVSRSFKMGEGILEFKAKADENAAIQAIIRGNIDSRSNYINEQVAYSSAYPGAEHTIAVNNVAKLNAGSAIKPKTDYIYKVTTNNSGIIFERYSSDYQKEAEIRFLDVNPSTGYIGLKASDNFLKSGSVYFDWVRARPFSEVEPKAGLLDKQANL